MTSRSGGDGPPTVAAESRLRSLRSEERADGSLSAASRTRDCSGLDERTVALVRVAALIAMGACTTSYRGSVDTALASGATAEDVVGTMLAIAPTVGLSRLVSATVGVALALGYDIDAALERLDQPADSWGEPDGTVGRVGPVGQMSPDHEELLRKLALNDEDAAASTLGALGNSPTSRLDPRTRALLTVAALIAAESALASYRWAVDSALAAGASDNDVVDVLIAVAPIVGLARLCSATPEVALALGYDFDRPVLA